MGQFRTIWEDVIVEGRMRRKPMLSWRSLKCPLCEELVKIRS
jgi:hypothetical protein